MRLDIEERKTKRLIFAAVFKDHCSVIMERLFIWFFRCLGIKIVIVSTRSNLAKEIIVQGSSKKEYNWQLPPHPHPVSPGLKCAGSSVRIRSGCDSLGAVSLRPKDNIYFLSFKINLSLRS